MKALVYALLLAAVSAPACSEPTAYRKRSGRHRANCSRTESVITCARVLMISPPKIGKSSSGSLTNTCAEVAQSPGCAPSRAGGARVEANRRLDPPI